MCVSVSKIYPSLSIHEPSDAACVTTRIHLDLQTSLLQSIYGTSMMPVPVSVDVCGVSAYVDVCVP